MNFKLENEICELAFFPFLFFILGMTIQLFLNHTNGLVNWLLFCMGLEIYLLLFFWFTHKLGRIVGEVRW